MARTTSTTPTVAKTDDTPHPTGEDPKVVDVTLSESEAPLPVGERSARAPGLRTEDEVVAHAAAVAEVTGHVGTAAEHVTRTVLVEIPDAKEVEFERADGATFKATEGTQSFRRMDESTEFVRA